MKTYTDRVKQQLKNIEKAKASYKRYKETESSPFLIGLAAQVRQETIRESKENIRNILKSE